MPDLRVLTSIPYGQSPRQNFDLFVPQTNEPLPVVVCIHGGWWSGGHQRDLRQLALHLAEEGYPAATVGFRQLAEGARSGHDVIDDLRTGIEKCVEEALILGCSGRSVTLLGSGSGSLLALSLGSVMLNAKSGIRPRAAIACGVTPSLEPWEGCPLALTKQLHAFAGSQAHLWSPMSLRADSFPPLLLLHGDADADVSARVAQKFHTRVVAANEPSTLAILSGIGHQFVENPFDRAGRSALEKILPFLAEFSHDPADIELRAPAGE